MLALAGVLALAGGCYARPFEPTDLAGTGGTGESCPEVVPLVGSACAPAEVGLSCGIPFSCDEWAEPAERRVTCEADGFWRQRSFTCEPWPPACPTVAPLPGSDCSVDEVGLVCGELLCEGEGPAAFTCGADGTWADTVVDCDAPAGVGGMGGATAHGGTAGFGGRD